MKTFITALSAGILLAGSVNVQPANAQRLDPARERAIQECSAMNKRYNNDPYSASGGVQHMYSACMTNHGYPP